MLTGISNFQETMISPEEQKKMEETRYPGIEIPKGLGQKLECKQFSALTERPDRVRVASRFQCGEVLHWCFSDFFTFCFFSCLYNQHHSFKIICFRQKKFFESLMVSPKQQPITYLPKITENE